MRGTTVRQVEKQTAVSRDTLVPPGYPIRRIKPKSNRALSQMSPTFDPVFGANGRGSIPPGNLLAANCRHPLDSTEEFGHQIQELVRRIPRKHGCYPNQQKTATQAVPYQGSMLSQS